MIGVARPTRGLEFAESAQSVEVNLRGLSYVIERSWDRPIPFSFNELVEKLLSYPEVNYIWFVEEDVVVPPGGLGAMLDLMSLGNGGRGHDIVAIRYCLKQREGVLSEQRDLDGNILWESLGCTLVRRQVFERLLKPWFLDGFTVAVVHEGSSCVKKTYRLAKSISDYGGQDTYFCWKALEGGFSIGCVEEMLADHLELEAVGPSRTNDGCHVIKRVAPLNGGNLVIRTE